MNLAQATVFGLPVLTIGLVGAAYFILRSQFPGLRRSKIHLN